MSSTSPTAVHGPSTAYRTFGIDEGFGIFGVYLFPHVIPLLFSMPAYELCNEMPDLITLLGTEGSRLEEEIITAESNEQRLHSMITFLEKCLPPMPIPAKNIANSIYALISTGGNIGIDRLASQSCLSRRQFERKFRYFSGLSPKAFARVIRFQSVVKEYGSGNRSLAAIALDRGYYDQSHLNRDFKAYSGYSPAMFFRGKSEGTGWLDAGQ